MPIIDLFASRPSKRISFLIVISLALIVSMIFLLQRKSENDARIDTATSQDLSAINTAIIAFTDQNDRMPVNLDELENLKSVLNYKLPDYNYTPEDSPYGVNTPGGYAFEICADFRTKGLLARHEHVTEGRPEIAFAHHNKGMQCYRNSVYKGGSHIALPFSSAIE